MRVFRAVFAVLALLALAAPALAAETVPFEQARFAVAQKEGQPILVHIQASWCPTCAAQRPILSQLMAKPEFKNLTVFSVDFDTQKDVVRAFGANMQSTLIGFKGTKETARSVGDTEAASIEKLLRSTEG